MANLKATVKPDFVKESGKSNIKIRLSHNKKVRYISTPWDIEAKFMNKNGTINEKYPGQLKLNIALNLLLAEYNGILEGVGKDIIYMDINVLVGKLKRNQDGGEGIVRFIKEKLKEYSSEGRTSYYYAFKAIIKHLQAFSGKDEVLFREINLDFLNRFRRHLIDSHFKTNSRRKYLSHLKEVFNLAIDNDIIKEELYPFRKFKMDKTELTEKRSLTVEQIKKLIKQPMADYQRVSLDLWLLSFYLLGVNFKDMLYWTPANIKNGRIEYLRFKTKGKKPVPMSVKLIPEAKEIISKYKGSKYLLKFMDFQTERKVSLHQDIVQTTNENLEKIAGKAGIDFKVTTYYARHSVATILYESGIAESVISECLGHSTGSRTTETYIRRNFDRVDEAQAKLIQLVTC